MKKILSLLMILAMVLTAASGFAATGSVVDGFYRYDEPVTVDVIYNVAITSPIEDFGESWIFEWARETMNIDFHVVQNIKSSSATDMLPLLFSADELPDAFMRLFAESEYMIKYGDYEGLLRPVNDLITEEITPHLYKIFAEDRPEVWSFPWCTPEGNLYYFPAILNNTEYNITCSHQPLWYNTEWFAAVGYEEAPATLDEFLDCMRRIKAEDPGNVGENLVPIAWYNSEKYCPDQIILNALGIIAGAEYRFDAYRKTGENTYEYVCIPYADEYYEYLKYMNILYSEGLVDKNMFTNDLNTYNAMVSAGYVACFTENESYLLVGDKAFGYDLLEPLTSDMNSEQFNVGGSGSLGSEPTLRRSAFMVLSVDCDDEAAEACARFVDAAYGYEGPDNEKRYIYWYGPQAGVDDTYGMTEGWYFDENMNRIVPEVVSGYYASDEAYRFSVTTNVNNEYMDRRTDGSEFEDGGIYAVTTIQGYDQWQKRLHFNPYLKYSTIILAYDEDTTMDQSALKSSIETYYKAEAAKFITGQRPLTDTEWAAYKQTLESYGILDYIENAESAFNNLYNGGIVE